MCHHFAVYRLTCYGFDLMRWRAAGKCEICRVDESALYRGVLVIDHDHRLGNSQNHIRGLICQKCNAAMKYVDNGFYLPTKAQLLYIYNAWFWDPRFVRDERRGEPFFPAKPRDGGLETRERWSREKRGRESILTWETRD